MKMMKIKTADGKEQAVNLEGLRTAESFQFANPNEKTGKLENCVLLTYGDKSKVFIKPFETKGDAQKVIDSIINS